MYHIFKASHFPSDLPAPSPLPGASGTHAKPCRLVVYVVPDDLDLVDCNNERPPQSALISVLHFAYSSIIAKCTSRHVVMCFDLSKVTTHHCWRWSPEGLLYTKSTSNMIRSELLLVPYACATPFRRLSAIIPLANTREWYVPFGISCWLLLSGLSMRTSARCEPKMHGRE